MHKVDRIALIAALQYSHERKLERAMCFYFLVGLALGWVVWG